MERAVIVLAALVCGCTQAPPELPPEPTLSHHVSVNEVMTSAVTPATNTLWGVQDPQTDEDWRALDDAAIVTLASFTLIKGGGNGANDQKWRDDPRWQQYADEVITAAIAARQAIRSRNLDDLLTAGEVLYPPCENCHQDFHPGMQ